MADNSYVAPLGGMRQLPYATADLGIPAATALGASATVNGTLITNTGNAKQVAVSGTASQNGNLVLTTYLDAAGTFVLETVTQAITGGGSATAVSTKWPFASFKMAITNTNAASGTCGANAGLAQG